MAERSFDDNLSAKEIMSKLRIGLGGCLQSQTCASVTCKKQQGNTCILIEEELACDFPYFVRIFYIFLFM